MIRGGLDGFPGEAVLDHPAAVLFQPGFQVLQYRAAQVLAYLGLLLRHQVLDALPELVKLADLTEGHNRLADLGTFLLGGCSLAGFNRLPAHLIPKPNASELAVTAHRI